MDEVKNVQPEQVSTTEPASTGDDAAKVAETIAKEPEAAKAPQPLTEERLLAILAEREERQRRDLQSVKDKSIAEIRREADRRVRLAEVERQGIESGLGEVDEDTKTKIELARYRARDKYSQNLAQEDEQRKQQEEFAQRLQKQTVDHLRDLGIDPDDKRLDWATDSTDYVSGRERLDASVRKVLKENAKAEKETLQRSLKDEVAKVRKDLGLDSVDTSVSATVTGGIPTRMEDFRKWISGISQEDYEKNYAAKVRDMQRKGLIK